MGYDGGILTAQMVHELVQHLKKKGLMTDKEYLEMINHAKLEVERKMQEAGIEP